MALGSWNITNIWPAPEKSGHISRKHATDSKIPKKKILLALKQSRDKFVQTRKNLAEGKRTLPKIQTKPANFWLSQTPLRVTRLPKISLQTEKIWLEYRRYKWNDGNSRQPSKNLTRFHFHFPNFEKYRPIRKSYLIHASETTNISPETEKV